MAFIGMKVFHVDANVVALSGIAIAIGTIVDMGIIICENILTRMDEAGPEESTLRIIYDASVEVGSAVLTAVSTTIVSFLPVFTMQAAEGKLFKPLAFTKTFALAASIIIALTVLPPLAHILFRRRKEGKASWRIRFTLPVLLIIAGTVLAWKVHILGLIVLCFGLYRLSLQFLPKKILPVLIRLENWLVILLVTVLLARSWQPLGIEKGEWANFLFVGLLIGGLLGTFQVFQWLYPILLRIFLRWKLAFLIFPLLIVIGGAMVWLGVPRLTGWMPDSIRRTKPMIRDVQLSGSVIIVSFTR
jgi:Cu(I)/Ag(I) efflux system membrane protein CusA/SilA